MMLDSGARGSKEQIRQLTGMRGLMAKPKNLLLVVVKLLKTRFFLTLRKVFLSLSTLFLLTVLFADTALKTADAGYLTRRLHDVSQDVIVNIEDCGTLRGVEVSALKKNEEIVESLGERILGRVALQDVINQLMRF
jgi:DNA-directed RNA polymerase subunit beta'